MCASSFLSLRHIQWLVVSNNHPVVVFVVLWVGVTLVYFLEGIRLPSFWWVFIVMWFEYDVDDVDDLADAILLYVLRVM